MKKIFFGVVIIALITVSISSQSILIKSPKGGSKWVPGNSMPIVWTANGNMDKYVKISVYTSPGGKQVLKIVAQTENDGNFNWNIPGDFYGGDYFIRVKTLNNKVWKDSGKVFIGNEVKNKNPGNSNLPYVNPNAGNTLHPKYMSRNTLVVEPIIVKFIAEKGTINYGESVKLFFHYKDIMKAHIYNRTIAQGNLLKNPKFPEFDSYIIVKPEKTSRFELNVSSAFKTIFKTCIVTVKGGPAPPPPPPPAKKLPEVTLFKAVPKVVDFGKGTILKLQATNAAIIIITDPEGNKVFDWKGLPSVVHNKNIPVKLYSENNTYKLLAKNNNGEYTSATWANWKSVIREFRVKSVNSQYIVFKYDYSLAEPAYIKMLNTNTNKWDIVLTLHCYGLSCARERSVKYRPGKYRLELIGSQGIVRSNALIVK